MWIRFLRYIRNVLLGEAFKPLTQEETAKTVVIHEDDY